MNLLIAGKLFSVEYSNQVGSIEGTFIAIARQIAAHPRDLLWWPLWDCGLPFQNTYLPLMHFIVAGLSALTGNSAALAYHQVAALFFCLGPMTMFLMAWVMTRQTGPSFAAALAYSIVSPSAILLPVMTHDLGSIWRLRRLQFLVQYGEGPETVAMALFPVAILFLYLAFRKRSFGMYVLAGVFMGLTVLANAFGGTILAMAAIALLASMGNKRFAAATLTTAILAWVWISPFFPPSVLAAMRTNSPTVEGDYRFTASSLAGCAILAVSLAVLWFLLRKGPLHIRFFSLFTLLVSGIVTLGYFAHMYVLPQPNRYQNVMDMGLCLVIAFAVPRRLPTAIVVIALCLAAVQSRNQVRFARGLIRPIDITQTAMYRSARWIDTHLHGERVMIGGPYSFYFNDFTDTPQVHGGHEPMLPNPRIRDAIYQIYDGKDRETSVRWLQALGAHAVLLPGDANFPLPVLWHEGADTIFAVPSVDSDWRWTSRHSVIVQAAGDKVSVPITFVPGWKATGGRIYKDEWGLMVAEGKGAIELTYDGGWELAATCAASSLVMLVTIVIGLVGAFHRHANVFGLLRRQPG